MVTTIIDKTPHQMYLSVNIVYVCHAHLLGILGPVGFAVDVGARHLFFNRMIGPIN